MNDKATSVRRTNALVETLKEQHPVRSGLVGESTELAGLFRRVRALSESKVPVLILGESGSGKECVARALHLNSPWASKPFEAEAGASMRDPTIFRHLFGHVRGAFTGATSSGEGLFSRCDGGSLFLDEVADIPLEIQGVLLRVLERGTFRTLGTSREQKTEFRLITSTATDLGSLVASGAFRRDLYYRLRGAVISVPPLRKRRGDISILADRFLKEACRQLNLPEKTIEAPLLEALNSYPWPGNVRELRSEMHQAAAMARTAPVTTCLIQFLGDATEGASATDMQPDRTADGVRGRLREYEAGAINDALRLTGGNKAKAARLLGLTRRTLYRRLELLGGDSMPDPALHERLIPPK